MNRKRQLRSLICISLALILACTPFFNADAVEGAPQSDPADIVQEQPAEADQQATDEKENAAEEDAAVEPEEESVEGESADGESKKVESTKGESKKAESTEAESTKEDIDAEEPGEEPSGESRTEYRCSTDGVEITAVLSDADIIPDDAKLSATRITDRTSGYNYNAYMEALNAGQEAVYSEKNTRLYDIAFIKDGKEIQPDGGTVTVTFDFKDKQLAGDLGAKKAADVNVIHLPLKDKVKDKYDTTADAKKISAADIKVEEVTKAGNDLAVSVKNEKVEFETSDFSVFAYTVDFEYGEYKFSIPGEGSIELSKIFEQLHIDKEVKDVENVTFSDPSLVEVKKKFFSNDWMLKSKKSFTSEETLTIEMKDGGEIVIKVTDPEVYPVSVNFTDFHDQPEAPTGLSGYYLRALIKDNESNQNVAGAFISVELNSATQTFDLNFTNRNGQSFNYDPSTQTLAIRLIHLVPGQWYTPTPPSDWMGAENLSFSDGYWFQTAPEGYSFTGTDIGSDSAVIGIKASKPVQLYIRIESDGFNKPEEDVHDVYAVAQIKHNSGNDTYGVEHIDSGIFTVLDDGTVYCDIPMTQWYSDKQGTVEKYDKFTGNEKNVSSTLYVAAGGEYAEIRVGEYLNEYEVVSYPSIDNGTGTDRVKDDSDPEVTKIYDVIHLKKNTDTFDKYGYTLEELLNGGYNIVTLCPNKKLTKTTTSEAEALSPEDIEPGDAFIGCHQMGGILIRGDAFFAAKVTGVADSPDADSPSVIGGMIGDTSGNGCFINSRTNNTDTTDFYAGSGNSIVGKFVNGKLHQQEVGGIKHDFNYCGATLVSDTFMDWDRLQAMVIDSSTLIANASTQTIHANNGDTVNVSLGSNVTIDAPEDAVITVNVVGEGAESSDAKGTVINFLNSGNAIVPKLKVNGNQLSTVETGEGISVVWNYPNATGTVQGPGESEFGHVVAPNALIKITVGNYSGTMIGNNAYIGGNAEGHLYPYKGGRIVPANIGLTVNKSIDGRDPAADQVYTFKLDSLKEGSWVNVQSKQNSGKTIQFDELKFTAAGTYWYKLYEDPESVNDGITADPTVYVLKVVVTEAEDSTEEDKKYEEVHQAYKVKTGKELLDADGNINENALEPAGTGEDATDVSNIEFLNTGIKKAFGVTKALEGFNWGESTSFDFTLAPYGIENESGTVDTTKENEVPMPAENDRSVTIDQNTSDHKAFFGEITYTHTGTYVYKINEVIPDDPIENVVYDERTYYAFVTVAKNEETQKLEATVTYKYAEKDADFSTATPVDANPDDTVTITNTKEDASGKATLKIKKALGEGDEWPADKSAVFTLEAKTDGAPMPTEEGGDTVTLTEAGVEGLFGEIVYPLDSAGETYEYTITETGDFGSGWTKTGPVTATVKVGEDTGTGTLETEVTYDPDTFTITNSYDAYGSIPLTGTKKFDNGNFADETFTFSIYKKSDFEAASSKLLGLKKVERNEQGSDEDLQSKKVASATTEGKTPDENGKVSFTFTPNIEFTLSELKPEDKKEDGSYEYHYVVVEDIPKSAVKKTVGEETFYYDSKRDIKYDGTVYEVTITVRDKGDGTLDVKASDNKTEFGFENAKEYTKLSLTKSIDKFIGEDTDGEYVNATLVFRLTYDDPVTGEKGKTREVSVQFDKDNVTSQTIEVDKIPIDTTVEVKEIYSSNYKPGATVNATKKTDKNGYPIWTVSLDNTQINTTTGSGIINNVDKNEDGKYEWNVGGESQDVPK